MLSRVHIGINHHDSVDPAAFANLLDRLIDLFEESPEFTLRSINHNFVTYFDESSRPQLWEPEDEKALFSISTRS